MAASVASTRKISSTLIPCSSLLPALLIFSAPLSSSWIGGEGRGLRRLSDITVEGDGYKGNGGRHIRSWSHPEPFTLTFLSCWFFSGHPAWMKVSTAVCIADKNAKSSDVCNEPSSTLPNPTSKISTSNAPPSHSSRTCKFPYLLASNPLP
jgi:hypothetical protein